MFCLIAGGKAATIAALAFTLSWTHSVEKTRWQEDWRVTAAGLEIAEARVAGSGAGMEPPDGAVLSGGVWRWRPVLTPMARLSLAASGTTAGGWRLCAAEIGCIEIAAAAGAPAEIRAGECDKAKD